MTDINPTKSIMLKVNGLTTALKTEVIRLDVKARPNYMLSTRKLT